MEPLYVGRRAEGQEITCMAPGCRNPSVKRRSKIFYCCWHSQPHIIKAMRNERLRARRAELMNDPEWVARQRGYKIKHYQRKSNDQATHTGDIPGRRAPQSVQLQPQSA